MTADRNPGDISPLTYLLESGSDRVGALDFQTSASAYEARSSEATLDERCSVTMRSSWTGSTVAKADGTVGSSFPR